MKHLQLFAVRSQDNVGVQLSKLLAAPMSHRINTAYCINEVLVAFEYWNSLLNIATSLILLQFIIFFNCFGTEMMEDIIISSWHPPPHFFLVQSFFELPVFMNSTSTSQKWTKDCEDLSKKPMFKHRHCAVSERWISINYILCSQFQ